MSTTPTPTTPSTATSREQLPVDQHQFVKPTTRSRTGSVPPGFSPGQKITKKVENILGTPPIQRHENQTTSVVGNLKRSDSTNNFSLGLLASPNRKELKSQFNNFSKQYSTQRVATPFRIAQEFSESVGNNEHQVHTPLKSNQQNQKATNLTNSETEKNSTSNSQVLPTTPNRQAFKSQCETFSKQISPKVTTPIKSAQMSSEGLANHEPVMTPLKSNQQNTQDTFLTGAQTTEGASHDSQEANTHLGLETQSQTPSTNSQENTISPPPSSQQQTFVLPNDQSSTPSLNGPQPSKLMDITNNNSSQNDSGNFLDLQQPSMHPNQNTNTVSLDSKDESSKVETPTTEQKPGSNDHLSTTNNEPQSIEHSNTQSSPASLPGSDEHLNLNSQTIVQHTTPSLDQSNGNSKVFNHALPHLKSANSEPSTPSSTNTQLKSEPTSSNQINSQIPTRLESSITSTDAFQNPNAAGNTPLLPESSNVKKPLRVTFTTLSDIPADDSEVDKKLSQFTNEQTNSKDNSNTNSLPVNPLNGATQQLQTSNSANSSTMLSTPHQVSFQTPPHPDRSGTVSSPLPSSPTIYSDTPAPTKNITRSSHIIKSGGDECGFVKTVAIITAVVSSILALFAALCIAGIFPQAFLGGMVGCCCTAASGGALVVGSFFIIWMRQETVSMHGKV